MLHEERISLLNDKKPSDGNYVLYWMQSSQRCEFNHALEYAIRRANKLHVGLLTFFALMDDFPEANSRHYRFMLEGLSTTASKMNELGISFIVQKISPPDGVVDLSREASLVVTDADYLRLQREWRSQVSSEVEVPLYQVESDVVVPVEVASQKEEYAAYTFRPRISKHLDSYLVPLEMSRPQERSPQIDTDSLPIHSVPEVLDELDLDQSVSRARFTGGSDEAKRHLQVFLRERIDRFPELRNDPSRDYLSNLSQYLHFGQISPVHVALQARSTESPGVDAFLEELVVRRELSINFVYYNPHYDELRSLPDWARTTLNEHSSDDREYIYTREEFEKADTHDPYWNAAQTEMVTTGKMHGYMRMYWGKKILEWSEKPEDAHRIALYLNNKYELDGRDPNGYTGVAWCFGKHDRAWKERPIFGKVRYMNDRGLERKFDIKDYVEQVRSL
ncbi:deoxyribodipyrimidine photo-lyase [Candidatus Thorarchaeota archaeon]|nr:MAG: deoxyribodipyrimidine photo-lyase [Candidatus Thorarchaeota archaeon]